MSVEVTEITTLARSRRGHRAGSPTGRPTQPVPRIRSSRDPATRGSLDDSSCTVARPESRFAQRLESVAFAALVVLSFVVAVSGIASLDQSDPTPTLTAGGPIWAYATGR